MNVWVVDDQAMDRTWAELTFAEHGGSVREFSSADAALADFVRGHACAKGPDGAEAEGPDGATPMLIVSDMNMPGTTGLEFARRIRQAGYTGTFVVLTGNVDSTSAAAARDAGADMLLFKPLTPKTAGGLMEAAQRRRSQQAAA